jgi:predicted DNA-binding transcriptional regulator YafY
MRADRLVAILLMLQSKGQVTAAEVAAELEVSERTARRDLDALGVAGLPIYSQQGRNGGWRLAGGGRTDLSGLTAAEARALFLVAGPASSATPAMKAALRKLVRALPESFRSAAEASTSSVVVDPVGWDRPAGTRRVPPLLDAAQQAVTEGRQVTLGYVARDRTASSRVVHPLGLAAKGSAWYLVAATDAGLRTFRVDRMTSVEPTGEAAVRPEGFDLNEAWRLITDEVDQRRAPVRASALAEPRAVPWCRATLGTRVRIGPSTPDGRVALELRGHSPRSLAAEVAGFGAALEVVEPPEVREQLRLIGEGLAERYAADTAFRRLVHRSGAQLSGKGSAGALSELLERALDTGDAGPLEAALSGSGALDLGVVWAFARTVGEIVGRPDAPVAALEALLDRWAALPEREPPLLPCAAAASYGEAAVARPEWFDDEMAKLRRAASDPRQPVREVVAQAVERIVEAEWGRRPPGGAPPVTAG